MKRKRKTAEKDLYLTHLYRMLLDYYKIDYYKINRKLQNK